MIIIIYIAAIIYLFLGVMLGLVYGRYWDKDYTTWENTKGVFTFLLMSVMWGPVLIFGRIIHNWRLPKDVKELNKSAKAQAEQFKNRK